MVTVAESPMQRMLARLVWCVVVLSDGMCRD